MARTTDLTQEQVNNIADDLHSKGVKPSPNNVREVLGTGSFSTIKQMLDVWKEKLKEEESIFVPETPEFAYSQVDKLHRELYLHNRRLLDSEREQLQLTKQEIEAEKAEMMAEINSLEAVVSSLKGDLSRKDSEVVSLKADLEKAQAKFDDLTNNFNAQKVEIATLTEREKQQTHQLKEKDDLINESKRLLNLEKQARQELETENTSLKADITSLKDSISTIKSELSKRDGELEQAKGELSKTKTKADELGVQLNAQTIEIATLHEREKQQALQMAEKEAMLKQAEKLEKSLNKQIEELLKKVGK